MCASYDALQRPDVTDLDRLRLIIRISILWIVTKSLTASAARLNRRLGVDGKVILKCMLRKYDVRLWTGFGWVSVRISAGML